MLAQKTESDVAVILKKKKNCRMSVSGNFPFVPKKNYPIVGIWYENTKDKGLIGGFIEGLRSLDIPVVLMSKCGDGKISFDFREKTATTTTKSSSWRTFFEACDIMVVLSDTLDENFFIDLWQNGIVPVAPESFHFLSNYNPNSEIGNSFTYSSKNIWEIFASTVRAIETYKFPYDWKHIVKQGAAFL